MNWRDALAEVLHRSASQHISALDAAAFGLARGLLPEADIQFCDPSTLACAPGQLALTIDALNDLDATQARALLARVRDYISPRIVVIARANCPLNRLDFLALGYEMLAVDEANRIALYQFDLATYKQVPDWLNARFWAHPERWKP